MKKEQKDNRIRFHKVVDEHHPEKSNTLIIGGVLLAISSIGLLIFVLSVKVFHFS
tara:strand:- start:443 stop:607 length:165 start_codon:yes stop_codon:yes gene_type:complete